MKPTRKTWQRIAGIALAVATVASIGACSTRSPSDMITLYYKSGAGDNKTFQECIQPGRSGAAPIDDQIFELPISLRTWNIRPDGKGDSKDAITSGSKPGNDGQPGPSVSIFASVDFYLNTDCTEGVNSPIVQFWQNLGRRYNISGDGEGKFHDDNWRVMLTNTLVTAEEKALREQTMRYPADAMDANLDNVWNKIQTGLETTFQTELRSKTGGNYFCGTGYQRGKTVTWDGPNGDKISGTCPPIRISISDINFTDPGIAEARAKVYKAQQEAREALIRAQAEVDKAALLSTAAKDTAYMEMLRIQAQLEAAKACAASSTCTLVIGADGVIAGKK